MKFIIDNKIPFISGALESVADVVYLPGNEIGAKDMKDADGLIIRTRTKCNKSLLEGSSVQLIATATIGYDHIDTDYCREKGIQWTNAPGCNSSSVEQYIVSVLLHLANKYYFKPQNKTIGIIGVGNVGRKVKRVSEALGFKVVCNDPPREREEGGTEFIPLDDLLKVADIITLHVPLYHKGVDKTYEMADASFFQNMKSASFFINSSRGEVVNEEELKRVLKDGRISAAVLDVFHNEPLLDPNLLKMLELATPHIAGYSTDGKSNGTYMSVQAMSKHFSLGLDSWKPDSVPPPPDPELFVDGSEGDSLTLITEVYTQIYNVQEDHQNLQEAPETFESLRGNYRLRREATAYNLRIFNDDGKYRTIFEQLGFSVIGDSCF